MQPTVPHLTRSSLHRRLPELDGDKPTKKRFASYPLGYFHIDLAEVQTVKGKLRLFVAISHQQAREATAPASLPLFDLWSVRARWRRPSSCAT